MLSRAMLHGWRIGIARLPHHSTLALAHSELWVNFSSSTQQASMEATGHRGEKRGRVDEPEACRVCGSRRHDVLHKSGAQAPRQCPFERLGMDLSPESKALVVSLLREFQMTNSILEHTEREADDWRRRKIAASRRTRLAKLSLGEEMRKVVEFKDKVQELGADKAVLCVEVHCFMKAHPEWTSSMRFSTW